MAEKRIDRAACIGGGVIGAGWVARLVINGIDVAVIDPNPATLSKIETTIAQAERAWSELTDLSLPQKGSWRIVDSIKDVSDAPLIIESAPERLEIKQAIYRDIEQYARETAIITSSTSGFKPSDLQTNAMYPERIIVAHPFNPVYLLPLVELVGGPQGDPSVIEQVRVFHQSIGMKPLLVRKEIDAFIADRLLEAVWREALWLVNDGIATTEEVDDAIRYGFGLRWAQMGLFETYRIAGGEAGMRHFLNQFGPSLKWPWTKLMDVPDLSDSLIDKIVGQSDQQSGEHSIQELERIRDGNLVAIIKGLKNNNWGAGQSLAHFEESLSVKKLAQ